MTYRLYTHYIVLQHLSKLYITEIFEAQYSSVIKTSLSMNSQLSSGKIRLKFILSSYFVCVKPMDWIYRGSYMSDHVLLNLLNELGKRDKMRGLPSTLSLFRNEFNKFINTRARMLDSIYHMINLISAVKTI